MYAIQLRDYQKECLETIISEYHAGINRQIVSLPTGSGKTVVMGGLTKHLNKRTIFLAHREELVTQAAEKFKLVWPDADIGICMADNNDTENKIIIGTIQSCSRPKRLQSLKDQGFDLMMIDEAHHAASDSYQSVIEALGFNNDPKRLFYLANVEGRKILTNLNLERIRSQNGDFCLEELSEAVNNPERNNFIVKKFKEYAANRKAIGFCVDVAHCQALTEAFRSEGIKAKAVWGDMDKSERRQVLDDFKRGRIQVVTSCGILCEGYDETSVDCVLMCRPTKSQALYIQCVGRGLRLHPGKENCLVMDFTDKGHNLDSVLSLSSALRDLIPVNEQCERQMPEEIDHTQKLLIVDEKDERFDILGNARFCWTNIGDGQWSLIDDERHEIIMMPEDGGYVALLYYPDFSSRHIVKTPIPIEYCSGVCEDFARRNLKIAFADTNAAWMNVKAQPTQNQHDYLQKQGAFREGMSKAEASLEIRRIIALRNKTRRQMSDEPITIKQAYFLRNKGIDIKGMTKLRAMQAISNLKQKQ